MNANRANEVTAVLPQEPSEFWLSLSQSRALPTAAFVASSILTLSSTFGGGAAKTGAATASDKVAVRKRVMGDSFSLPRVPPLTPGPSPPRGEGNRFVTSCPPA